MNPTFIGCTARSGSTLLRWLIDSHPMVACPSETDAALLLGSESRTAGALWGPDNLTERLWPRRVIEDLVERYLAKHSKAYWCDKSMSNALNLDLLAQTWPFSRFIFLHRHVMDFIASALEAQPWGLVDYGFAPYAAQFPGDSVGALARYWLDRTARMIEFEDRSGHKCVTVRYEDLVSDPAQALTPVWKVLGVNMPLHSPDAALTLPHDAYGSADHQIWYTSAIHGEGLEKGVRIPPDRLDGELRLRVNRCLDSLGYSRVTDAWGAGGPLLPPGEPGGVRIVSGHRIVTSQHVWDGELSQVVAVDVDAVEGLITGRLNVGAAIRSRSVRYYGPPFTSYGEERSMFSVLPKVLSEMVV